MLTDSNACNFGWKAPEFELKTPEGVAHKMSDHLDKALLITFICNHCPYVKAIADRLAKDAQVLRQNGVGVLAINSNDYRSYPSDAPPKMVDFAAAYGFDFPYLVDEDQSVASAYGAVCTPDFFGLNATGELQYRGRFDNALMGDPSNRTPEMLNAMLQIAETGKGPEQQVATMGCSIKWR